MSKYFGWFLLTTTIVCVSFAQESRTPKWPLPKPLRSLSSTDSFRISEYRNYVKSLSEKELSEFALDAKISLGDLGISPKKVIVKFKDSQTESAVLEALGNPKLKPKKISIVNVHVLSIPQGSGNREVLAHLGALKELSGVEYAYPDYKIKIANTPNDTHYVNQNQWPLHNLGADTPAGTGLLDADIDAPEAWMVSTGSSSVVVAILDTGIDYNHPDLVDNLWKNPGETGTDANGADKSTNGVDDDGNGFIDDFRGWDFVEGDNDPFDYHGHGTHVAGTIGAKGNNGRDVVGVNWQVGLVALQIFDESGYGDLSEAMAAIEYATRMGFPITNNSWGGGVYNEALKELIEKNRDAGSLFVAAAGNSATDLNSTPFYPASYSVDNIIAVGATDNKDKWAYFSNYGSNQVHLAAPGLNVLSTFMNGGIYYESGTSMAAPHVAGAAALVKAVWPNLTYSQIKSKILDSVDVIYDQTFEGKTITGGRLNLARAVGGEPSPLPYRLALKGNSPKVGPNSGGTLLTIEGGGFHPDVQVRIGSKPCAQIQVISQTKLTCVTPATSLQALHNIVATNPDGNRKALFGAFRYHPLPVVSGISPSSGLITCGNTLTLTGSNFLNGMKVKVGEKDCLNVNVASSTQLTCRLPAYEQGEYAVKAINPYGQESVEAIQYSYFEHPAPQVNGVSPTVGPLAGGNTLTISGTGFRTGAIARVGGLDCTNVTVLSAQKLTCQAPARPAGTFSIAVLNSDLQKGVLAAAYSYRAAPQVSSFSPTRGLSSGGGVLTIQGSHFISGATVRIGNQVCTNPQVVSASQIRCTIPSNSVGNHSVIVMNPEGQNSTTVGNLLFQVINPRWLATNGGSCITVCNAQQMISMKSPEGAHCTSGEVIPASALGVISYRRGCAPNRSCPVQGRINGATSQGQFCYGPGQPKNRQATDITQGCYCGL